VPNVTFISPFFIVADIKAAVAFYVDKLGFEVLHMGPEDKPFFAMVGRGNVTIMLKEIADDIKPVPNHTRHEWASWDAYIFTQDPDLLFKEFQSNGITFRQPILNNSDGLRGFEVADADGYVLFFGRPQSLTN